MAEDQGGTTPSFAEIRDLMRALPGPDLDAASACAAREATLVKPAGALGRLEEIALWLATWQSRHPPQVRHPRIAVFAGNHGVAAQGVSAYPQDVTAQMVAGFQAGRAAVNQLCALAEADLRIYELALDLPTEDFTEHPAMDEAECARAIAYGMMAVEPGVDLLAVGEMGIANTTSAAALCLALFGGEAADWVGPGTGVAGVRLEAKRAAVAAGVARHRERAADPLGLLACLGGREFAAILGALLAARMARVPVLLDGFACTAAAAVAFAIDRRALDHCMVAHRSTEPGHTRLLGILGKRPLLELEMRLGEASGAALAIGIVKAAAACHAGMGSFAETGVSGPAR